MKNNLKEIENLYQVAKDKYSKFGVDTEKALEELQTLALSLHCWQTDDVAGLERPEGQLSGGGIQATGNYPGKARNIDEIRMDMEKVFELIPGKHRFNLHASYGDFEGKDIDRNEIQPDHFDSWLDWAKPLGIKLDFNSTCFSHPKADDGFTLSSLEDEVQDFWIEHVNRAREISAHMGEVQQSRCIHNIWIPDGTKDLTVNRFLHRERLRDALDQIFTRDFPASAMADSIESKLFGIGSEAFVVGSHEFYMGYGMTRNKMICIDMGHFHPTELVADKVSSLLLFGDELMFHFSRGVRWDSDHVVLKNDEVDALTREIIRANALERVNIGLDFFDASINRVGAYVIGSRATQISFLQAMLEPTETIREYENAGKGFEKLALLEQTKMLPFADVWNYFCLTNDVPAGTDFIENIGDYEKNVLSKRI
jgi:L-rhamnose isomerase